MIIEFKEIPGCKDYFISKDGIIISKKAGKGTRRAALRQYSHTTKCFGADLMVNGEKKKFKVHRLVALTWIKNPENKPQVNHVNGNRYDNRVENLEWVTDSENKKHAHRVLKRARGSNPKKSKEIERAIPLIKALLSVGKKQVDIAKRFGVDPSVISDINRNKRSCFKTYEPQERVLT